MSNWETNKIGKGRLLRVIGIMYLLPMTFFQLAYSRALAAPYSKGLDLEFLNKVGGIRIGQVRRCKDGSIELPVSVDISGLKEISRKPTSVNSMKFPLLHGQ